jgi:hypothetical protein
MSAFFSGHKDLQVGLPDARWRKVLVESDGKPFVLGVLFGALTSRSAIGCENTERQLLLVISVLFLNIQANYVGNGKPILMVLVHGFDVWCNDRDDFVTHISHKAVELVSWCTVRDALSGVRQFA